MNPRRDGVSGPKGAGRRNAALQLAALPHCELALNRSAELPCGAERRPKRTKSRLDTLRALFGTIVMTVTLSEGDA